MLKDPPQIGTGDAPVEMKIGTFWIDKNDKELVLVTKLHRNGDDQMFECITFGFFAGTNKTFGPLNNIHIRNKANCQPFLGTVTTDTTK